MFTSEINIVYKFEEVDDESVEKKDGSNPAEGEAADADEDEDEDDEDDSSGDDSSDKN